MIKGLTLNGIGRFPDMDTYIEQAARYGFGAVDTEAAPLRSWLDSKNAEAARAHLEEHGVIVGSFGLPVEWRQGEERFRADLAKLTEYAAAAASIGCTACCTYVLPSTDQEPVRFMAVATRRLRQCAQILGAYGIRFGLEFVGPHHLRTAWKHPFIWDQTSFLDWIDAIDERNVGLLYDAFHWYTSEASYADILRLKPEQIVHVHLNDARPVPVADVLDNDRLYPGEGAIDLAAFLRGLREIGYTGVVSQEILTKEPPAGSTDELLQRSADGYAKVFRAAGLE